MVDVPGTLLCVSNYPANTGYAWDFIERLYASIADHMVGHGVRTFVAYPSLPASPRTLMGSAACPVALDASLDTRDSLRTTVEFIRRENVRVVYFTDRPARCWSYLDLRCAGVRRIIVHDHASGDRERPLGLKCVAKWLVVRVPGILADVVVTVSEYVARRQIDVGLIPAARVVTVWNGLPAAGRDIAFGRSVREIFGLEVGRPLVVCACRASDEKGVKHLLRAFDMVERDASAGAPRPALLYLGDGPQLAELRSVREALSSKDDIILAGYRRDAANIVRGADLCVVPSVWQDAFPLAVLEAMANGRPVIASRVGGVPEMIEHGISGLLVPPADERALAGAIHALLKDPTQAAWLGEMARQRVAARFNPERQLRLLTSLVEEGFGVPCDAVRHTTGDQSIPSSQPSRFATSRFH